MSVLVIALSGALASAQPRPKPGVEAQVILTVADHMNHAPAVLKPDDVSILDATITEWRPLDAGRDLELFLLIDDAANYDFKTKLEELRQFANAEPAGVPIGVAYIHDGALQIAEMPTTDRAKVGRALRVPSGSKAANPYCALSDLMERWQKKSLRREVILVSTGIDDSAAPGAVCVNAETTIRDAQRAGIEIYALYNPVNYYLSEDWSKVDSGVTDLAHVCYETGGESYFRGHSPIESLGPYLADIAEHLAHQYLVKFRLSRSPASGFQAIYVLGGSSNPELMVPESVWIAPSANK
jgi:hypothetical protein